jgi:hydroxymethylpyrimidine/phosphomethylpyrimidine kinase
VQSTSGVKRVQAVDPSLISDTLEELAADLDIAAVHIGMLGSAKVVKAVADFLSSQKGSRPSGKSRLPNIVLDPILKSSSGADLLDPAGTRLLIERLIPLADVVTPNVDEAAALTGLKVTDLDEMKAAAAKLHAMGSSAVVITGGHLEKATDLLSFTTKRGSPEMTGSSHQQEEPGIEAELGKGMEPQFEQEVFKAERQRSNSTHGTGCAFATGLAEAALLAKTYVTAAITNAHPLGRGTGPVHHLYRMSQQRRAAGSGSEQS